MRQLGTTSASRHVSFRQKSTTYLLPRKKCPGRARRAEGRGARKSHRKLRNDCCRRFCFVLSAASRLETKENALADSFRSPFLRYPLSPRPLPALCSRPLSPFGRSEGDECCHLLRHIYSRGDATVKTFLQRPKGGIHRGSCDLSDLSSNTPLSP